MGFAGIFVILDLLGISLGRATTDLIEKAGIHLPAIDLG